MKRAVTILSLVGFLVAGAAAAGMLAQDGFSSARGDREAALAKGPQANRETKNDKLTLYMASFPTADQAIGDQAIADQASEPQLPEPLRQAFASVDAPVSAPRQMTAPVVIPNQQAALPVQPQAVPAKPKAAARPAPQKTYALLSDVQIAGIRERLRLSSSQEAYWPAVETALRAVARKIHATKQANPNGPIIDPSSDEVSQLKSAAMPLLFQLREDQKREVRQLANVIGLSAVASMI